MTKTTNNAKLGDNEDFVTFGSKAPHGNGEPLPWANVPSTNDVDSRCWSELSRSEQRERKTRRSTMLDAVGFTCNSGEVITDDEWRELDTDIQQVQKIRDRYTS